MADDLKKVFAALKKKYQAGTITAKTTYYFSLGDDAKWSIVVGPKDVVVKPEKLEPADCVVKTTPELFAKMVSGEWKPGMMDFMSGKVKTSSPEKLKLFAKAFGLG
jgi:long-chain acyl-CoA synthetase